MRTLGTLFTLALLTVGAVQAAGQVQVAVQGNQGPWSQSLNPTYTYGPNDNADPTVISAASGISFVPGGTITVTYVSGTVSVCPGPPNNCPYTDPNGWSAFPTNNYDGPACGYFPSDYMSPYPIYASELVGTFGYNGSNATQPGTIVGSPFSIGDGPATFIIPAGANQLLLGVDDNCYNDNGGSWTLSVSSATALPPAMPIGVENILSKVTSLDVVASPSCPVNFVALTCFSAQQNFWVSTPGSPDSPSFWAQNALFIWEDLLGQWSVGHEYFIWNTNDGVVNDLIACNGTPEFKKGTGWTCTGSLDFGNTERASWQPSDSALKLTSSLSGSSGSEILTLGVSVGSKKLESYSFSGNSGNPLPINSSILAATSAQQAEQFGYAGEPEFMLVGWGNSSAAEFGENTTGQISSLFENTSGVWQAAGTQYAITAPGTSYSSCSATSETSSGLYWSSGNLTNPALFQDPGSSSTFPAEGTIFVPASGAGPVAFSQCQCGTSATGICAP